MKTALVLMLVGLILIGIGTFFAKISGSKLTKLAKENPKSQREDKYLISLCAGIFGMAIGILPLALGTTIGFIKIIIPLP